MNSHELQKRIQGGDRDAFRELYAVCGQGVYLTAQEALGDADAARDAVKQIFLNLHHEILSSDHPLDIDARLLALTEEELRTRRILGGDLSAEPASEAPPAPIAPPASEAPPATEAKPAPEAPSAPQEAAPPPPAPDPIEEAAPYSPPLERAQAHMEADEELARRRKKREQRAERPSGQRGNAVITILIVIFLLLFLWVLAGILMDFEILPRIELGYRWFNESVFPLFNLEA